jgi:predicted nucleic acid-binding protein
MRYHLDTDFLVYALSTVGPERRRLRVLADSEAEIQMSAIAWYEFSRGPRTPEQLAVARSFLGEEGVLSFSEGVAAEAADVFRRLGSPRKRAADVAIGVTAVVHEAQLVTRNARDFAGIPGLVVEAVRSRNGR